MPPVEAIATMLGREVSIVYNGNGGAYFAELLGVVEDRIAFRESVAIVHDHLTAPPARCNGLRCQLVFRPTP